MLEFELAINTVDYTKRPFGLDDKADKPACIDIYESAESAIKLYYPSLIPCLIEAGENKPDSFHVAVTEKLPIILVKMPQKLGGGIIVKLPQIDCTQTARNALKVSIVIHNRGLEVFPSDNGLMADYLEFNANAASEDIYHIGYKNPADYIVLSTLGLFSNDNEQRQIEFSD